MINELLLNKKVLKRSILFSIIMLIFCLTACMNEEKFETSAGDRLTFSMDTLKMDTVIAIYEGNGVSEQGNWCEQQILCANVVFRHGKFSKLYLDFIKWKLKHLVPRKIREYIRLRQYEINQ